MYIKAEVIYSQFKWLWKEHLSYFMNISIVEIIFMYCNNLGFSWLASHENIHISAFWFKLHVKKNEHVHLPLDVQGNVLDNWYTLLSNRDANVPNSIYYIV